MNTKSRIASILNTKSLDSSTTHIPAFDLSNLILPRDLDFPLPTNLRLGHLAEKVVSNSITSSSNYNILFEMIVDRGLFGREKDSLATTVATTLNGL